MLLTSLAFLMTLQSSGETLTTVRNDDPETWVVEYPQLIRSSVVQYRQCLNVSNRLVTGKADFEIQHRSDIPRCAKERERAMDAAREQMQGAKTRLSEDELDTLFRNVGLIHIARGRDLDQQFNDRVTASTAATSQYEDERPKGLVLELVDGSVVKSLAEIQAQAESTEKTEVND